MSKNVSFPKRRQRVNSKLSNIDEDRVKVRYKSNWFRDKPTAGYCYILAEVLYHYEFKKAKSYCVNLDEQGYEGLGTHWFLKSKGQIIDFAGEQYDFDIPYNKARRRTFLKGSVETDRGWISKRGYKLAKLLGYVD